MKLKICLSLNAVLGLLLLSACGGSSGGANVNGLSGLPDASNLFAASSSSSLSWAAVTGTPPLLTDLVDDPDAYFWDSFLSTLHSPLTFATNDDWRAAEKKLYGGGQDGDPAGNGACMMAATVGQTVRQLSSNTMCYIKGMSENEDAPIEPSVGDRSSVFKQASSDKWVKVAVSGDEHGGNMNVFIRVVGSDNLEGDKYKLELHFCESASVTGREVITVDRSTEAYNSTEYGSEENGTHQNSISAYLIKSGTGFDWDPAKGRTGESFFEGSYGGHSQKYKSKVTLDGSDLTARAISDGDFGVNKNYSLLSITGSGASSLRFLEGAFTNRNEPTCDGCNSGTYSGQAQYNGSFYESTASGTYASEIAAYDISADSFFSEAIGSVDTTSLTDVSCDQTVDYTITMDFSTPAVAALQSTCEDRAFDGEFNQMCWGSSFQSAQNYLYTVYVAP